MHRMGRLECFQLILHLFFEYFWRRCRGDEAEEGWGGVEWARAELRVSLQADEERMICAMSIIDIGTHKQWMIRTLQFKDLHTFAFLVTTNE